MKVVSGAIEKVSFVILGRPSHFRMPIISYILRAKVSSFTHAEMIVSDSSVSSDFFSAMVYCLPSTRASIRVGEKLVDLFDNGLGEALDR